jgi:hypothetical protein
LNTVNTSQNRNNTIETSGTVNASRIGVVAYQMWEKAGRPAGQDMQFWLDAEAQLRTAAKASLTAQPARPAPVELKPAPVQKAPVQQGPRQPEPVKPQQKFRRY